MTTTQQRREQYEELGVTPLLITVREQIADGKAPKKEELEAAYRDLFDDLVSALELIKAADATSGPTDAALNSIARDYDALEARVAKILGFHRVSMQAAALDALEKEFDNGKWINPEVSESLSPASAGEDDS